MLPGASPYTILTTDTEFKVTANRTDDNVDYPVGFTRNRLSAVARSYAVAESQPGDNHQWYGFTAALNSAGTELIVAEAGQNLGLFSIAAVEAR